jgi:hypothetical protein
MTLFCICITAEHNEMIIYLCNTHAVILTQYTYAIIYLCVHDAKNRLMIPCLSFDFVKIVYLRPVKKKLPNFSKCLTNLYFDWSKYHFEQFNLIDLIRQKMNFNALELYRQERYVKVEIPNSYIFRFINFTIDLVVSK